MQHVGAVILEVGVVVLEVLCPKAITNVCYECANNLEVKGHFLPDEHFRGFLLHCSLWQRNLHVDEGGVA